MLSKGLAASAVAATLVGVGAGMAVWSAQDAPVPGHQLTASREQLDPHAGVPVEIDDPQDVLSAEDEARVRRDAERLELPGVVTGLYYVVFEENEDNVLDSLEEHVREHRPGLIAPDDDHYSDGALIVGVGLDPRNAFVGCGNDVCDALHLWRGTALDAALDAMKPGVKDGDIPAGLLSATRTATDIPALERRLYDAAVGDRTATGIGAGVGAGVVTGGVGGSLTLVRHGRRKKAAQARADLDLVLNNYGKIAGRLPDIDVRAHSLSSPLADDHLRGQWARVRDRFLALNDQVSGARGLGSLDTGDDKAMAGQHEALSRAAATITQIETAEGNVNRLFDIERGDEAARRADVEKLRADVRAAALGTRNGELKAELKAIQRRVEGLSARVLDADFLPSLVRVIEDYQATLEEVKRRELSDVKEYKKLRRPALYEPDYRYSNVVTYVMLTSWHSSNVEAHEAARAQSSTNTTYSSGFSGGGGSSSF
ncbi:DUF5129 domain-containing protein [Corynebacterium mastitidis]|uniref:DUF5129 domain-containing protein n=2 Tax=Corynebacterium mastitidis TaxID=161890 RepID=A0A2N0X8C2_9CORY|nr:DUF5129 domain-containing protein [Corynebacterium mastitidis]